MPNDVMRPAVRAIIIGPEVHGMRWELMLAGGGFVLMLLFVGMVARCYRRVEQGKALIVTGLGPEPRVSLTGALVYPILQKAEVLDISVKKIVIELIGPRALICRDDIRANLEASFC
jgi:uncharacterized membrane protein YqiK